MSGLLCDRSFEAPSGHCQTSRCSNMKPRQEPLALMALNHISRTTEDVAVSTAFFRDTLGFCECRRPKALDFEGAWLFGMGVGIHLISRTESEAKAKLDLLADHISFTCSDLHRVEQQLKSTGIPYAKQTFVEMNITISQLFFKDPGGSGMVEVCNCDCLPVIMQP